MELDLYDASLRVAIEYDGPQHYEFPNRYHTTRCEFEAQQARDRTKDDLCANEGVQLIRVRSVGDVDVEVANALAALGQVMERRRCE